MKRRPERHDTKRSEAGRQLLGSHGGQIGEATGGAQLRAHGEHVEGRVQSFASGMVG